MIWLDEKVKRPAFLVSVSSLSRAHLLEKRSPDLAMHIKYKR